MGVFILIWPGKVVQLILATAVALVVLCAEAISHPYEKMTDNAVAISCDFCLVFFFVSTLIIKITTITDQIDDLTPSMQDTLELPELFMSLLMLGTLLFSLVFCGVVLFMSITQSAAEELKALLAAQAEEAARGRMSVPPVCEWQLEKGHKYCTFLSHYKVEAGSDARYLSDLIRRMTGQPSYLDSTDLVDLRMLFHDGVHKTDVVVILATKGVLTRPWCVMEMWEAALHQIPIVLFPVVGGGFDLTDAKNLLGNLEVEMESRNQYCMPEVMAHVRKNAGVTDVREVEDVLLAHIGVTDDLHRPGRPRAPRQAQTSQSSLLRSASAAHLLTSAPRAGGAGSVEALASAAQVKGTATVAEAVRRRGGFNDGRSAPGASSATAEDSVAPSPPPSPPLGLKRKGPKGKDGHSSTSRRSPTMKDMSDAGKTIAAKMERAAAAAAHEVAAAAHDVAAAAHDVQDAAHNLVEAAYLRHHHEVQHEEEDDPSKHPGTRYDEKLAKHLGRKPEDLEEWMKEHHSVTKERLEFLSWQSWGTDNQIIASVQTLMNECALEMGRPLPTWVEKAKNAVVGAKKAEEAKKRGSKRLSLLRKKVEEVAEEKLLLISSGEEGGSHVRMLQHEFSQRLGCEVLCGTENVSMWREQLLDATRGVVLLQTKSVLAHPVRLLQLFEMVSEGRPLVCVNVVGGGYDFGKTKPFLQNLATELPNFSTLRDELAKSNLTVGKLVRSLCKAVPMSISVFFNPGGTDVAQDAAIRDVIDKLARAQALADTLNESNEEKEQAIASVPVGRWKSGKVAFKATIQGVQAALEIQKRYDAAVEIQKIQRSRQVRSSLRATFEVAKISAKHAKAKLSPTEEAAMSRVSRRRAAAKGYSATHLIARAMFDRHAGGDDEIDAEELRGLMKELANELDDDEHKLVMSKLDTSGDGKVGFDEFCKWWDVGLSMEKLLDENFSKDLGRSRARSLFLKHAGEKNEVDLDDLEELCKELGHTLDQEQLQLVMAKLDLDGDGGVCYDEFLAWWDAGLKVETLLDAEFNKKLGQVGSGPADAVIRRSAAMHAVKVRQKMKLHAARARAAAHPLQHLEEIQQGDREASVRAARRPPPPESRTSTLTGPLARPL